MFIVNKTNLKLLNIILIINEIIKSQIGETHYYGKKDVVILKAYKKVLKIEIIYLKRYTKWIISEKKLRTKKGDK